MSIININGTDLELDLLDADVMERYERLNRDIVVKIQEPTQYEGLSAADGMRLQCRYVDGFFDDLFGPGTAEKVFGGGSNLGVRLDAFAQVASESEGIRGQLTSITDKYGIGRVQNRGQNSQHRKNGGGGKKSYHYYGGRK